MNELRKLDESKRRQEARKRHAVERLGNPHPRCAACGEDDPRCLEQHHIPGRKFGDDLVPVCPNCHRKLSDDQKDHPAPIGGEPSLLEQIGHLLFGLADLLVLAAEKLIEAGEKLIELARTACHERSQSCPT